jgi:hypothetical protein
MTTLDAIKLALVLETGQRDRPLHYAKALSDGIKEKTPRWEKPYERTRDAFFLGFFGGFIFSLLDPEYALDVVMVSLVTMQPPPWLQARPS